VPRVGVDLGGGSFFTLANNKVEMKKITMTAMADMMTRSSIGRSST
jgi:hypothetical protein